MLSSTEIQPDFDALTGDGFLSIWSYGKIVAVEKSLVIDLEFLAAWAEDNKGQDYGMYMWG